MKQHRTLLQDGYYRNVAIVYELHNIGVHRGTSHATRDRWVITDLTTDHTFANAHGTILSFVALEDAIAALGVMLVTQYGFDRRGALEMIRKGGQE